MKLIRPTEVGDAELTSSNVAETVDPFDSDAVYYAGQTARNDADHGIYESQSGAAPVTVTITIATPAVVTQAAHGLADGTTVAFSTDGALPTGLTAGAVYYVVNGTTDTYEVEATVGGGSIATSGSQSGTHSAISDPNRGNALTDVAHWVRTGPTNRWACYDEYNQTQKEQAESFEDAIDLSGLVNGIAFLNIDAATIDIEIEDSFEGVIYSETFNLVDNSNIGDVYDYFFEPIIRKTKLVLRDLPPAYDPTITYSVNAPGGTARLGNFIPGQVRDLGDTMIAAGFGIADHSKITEDDFGNTSVSERPYRNTMTADIALTRTPADEVGRILTSRRAKPTVFIGSGQYASLTVLGFPTQWRGLLDELKKFTLEVRGLS